MDWSVIQVNLVKRMWNFYCCFTSRWLGWSDMEINLHSTSSCSSHHLIVNVQSKWKVSQICMGSPEHLLSDWFNQLRPGLQDGLLKCTGVLNPSKCFKLRLEGPCCKCSMRSLQCASSLGSWHKVAAPHFRERVPGARLEIAAGITTNSQTTAQQKQTASLHLIY